MKTSLAEAIIWKNAEAYKKIEGHFSQTRYKAWPEFDIFKEYIQPGMSVLDAGSGNSRLFNELKNADIRYTAIDNNTSFIKHASRVFADNPRATQFTVADLRKLPFPDAHFDIVFCIAALYHIPSQTFRQQAINEFARVLKPGGYLMMLNWNLWQKRFRKYHAAALADIITRKLDIGDCWIPWKNPQGDIKAERYGHAFTKRELRKLHQRAGLEICHLAHTPKTPGFGNMTAHNILSIAHKKR